MEKQDPLFSDIIAWAESKPPRGRYNYFSNTNCAIAQYLKYREVVFLGCLAREWYDGGGFHPIPDWIADASVRGRSTFGGFARRLRRGNPNRKGLLTRVRELLIG